MFTLRSMLKKLGVQSTILWTLLSNSRLEPRVKIGSSKRSVYFEKTNKLSWESNVTLAPLHFFHTLDPNPSVNSLDPKIYYKSIRPSLRWKFVNLMINMTI